jgi:hypothetical protein
MVWFILFKFDFFDGIGGIKYYVFESFLGLKAKNEAQR